ncbi:MAG: GtrA family protein [Pseudomonadota bacterium]|uniref:GtrA family protein n=1 Tax=Ralstonia pickettii TaxID=329 RepID=UPI0027154ECD|nr:GtrA family protein [Ralstonia pickettii]MEE2975870.1 GtrA family protein [Pseudomonadota bacterium]WKZ88179.1 GtrA family protein [Ralstonia pickettii]
MIEHNTGSKVDGVSARMASRRHFWAAVEQFARYVVIGGGATLAHYVVLFGLVQAGVSPWRASVAGSAIGATLNYFISRQAVFNSTRGHIGSMVRFGLVAILALGCNATIMAIGLGIGLYYLIAQVFASAITAVFNFLVHRYWTFRDADTVGAPTEPQPDIVLERPARKGP